MIHQYFQAADGARLAYRGEGTGITVVGLAGLTRDGRDFDYLARHGLGLEGNEVVDVGSWEGQASHALSVRLSPLHVRATGHPKMTLEQFWQEKKCLAVWEESLLG